MSKQQFVPKMCTQNKNLHTKVMHNTKISNFQNVQKNNRLSWTIQQNLLLSCALYPDEAKIQVYKVLFTVGWGQLVPAAQDRGRWRTVVDGLCSRRGEGP